MVNNINKKYVGNLNKSTSSIGIPSIFFKNKSILNFNQLSNFPKVNDFPRSEYISKQSIYSEKVSHRARQTVLTDILNIEEQCIQSFKILESKKRKIDPKIETETKSKKLCMDEVNFIDSSFDFGRNKRSFHMNQTNLNHIVNFSQTKTLKSHDYNSRRKVDKELTLRDETFLSNPYLFEQSFSDNIVIKKCIPNNTHKIKLIENLNSVTRCKPTDVDEKIMNLEFSKCENLPINQYKTKSISQLLSEIDNHRLMCNKEKKLSSSKTINQRCENIKKMLSDAIPNKEKNNSKGSQMIHFKEDLINNVLQSITNSNEMINSTLNISETVATELPKINYDFSKHATNNISSNNAIDKLCGFDKDIRNEHISKIDLNLKTMDKISVPTNFENVNNELVVNQTTNHQTINSFSIKLNVGKIDNQEIQIPNIPISSISNLSHSKEVNLITKSINNETNRNSLDSGQNTATNTLLKGKNLINELTKPEPFLTNNSKPSKPHYFNLKENKGVENIERVISDKDIDSKNISNVNNGIVQFSTLASSMTSTKIPVNLNSNKTFSFEESVNLHNAFEKVSNISSAVEKTNNVLSAFGTNNIIDLIGSPANAPSVFGQSSNNSNLFEKSFDELSSFDQLTKSINSSEKSTTSLLTSQSINLSEQESTMSVNQSINPSNLSGKINNVTQSLDLSDNTPKSSSLISPSSSTLHFRQLYNVKNSSISSAKTESLFGQNILSRSSDQTVIARNLFDISNNFTNSSVLTANTPSIFGPNAMVSSSVDQLTNVQNLVRQSDNVSNSSEIFANETGVLTQKTDSESISESTITPNLFGISSNVTNSSRNTLSVFGQNFTECSSFAPTSNLINSFGKSSNTRSLFDQTSEVSSSIQPPSNLIDSFEKSDTTSIPIVQIDNTPSLFNQSISGKNSSLQSMSNSSGQLINTSSVFRQTTNLFDQNSVTNLPNLFGQSLNSSNIIGQPTYSSEASDNTHIFRPANQPEMNEISLFRQTKSSNHVFGETKEKNNITPSFPTLKFNKETTSHNFTYGNNQNNHDSSFQKQENYIFNDSQNKQLIQSANEFKPEHQFKLSATHVSNFQFGQDKSDIKQDLFNNSRTKLNSRRK